MTAVNKLNEFGLCTRVFERSSSVKRNSALLISAQYLWFSYQHAWQNDRAAQCDIYFYFKE